jgi:hypothetical protein
MQDEEFGKMTELAKVVPSLQQLPAQAWLEMSNLRNKGKVSKIVQQAGQPSPQQQQAQQIALLERGREGQGDQSKVALNLANAQAKGAACRRTASSRCCRGAGRCGHPGQKRQREPQGRAGSKDAGRHRIFAMADHGHRLRENPSWEDQQAHEQSQNAQRASSSQFSKAYRRRDTGDSAASFKGDGRCRA